MEFGGFNDFASWDNEYIDSYGYSVRSVEEDTSKYHILKENDSVDRICKKYNITLADLVVFNPELRLTTTNVYEGMKIRIKK
ncbi:hypothetical protein FACS189428_3300 [Clostridia bacterium]|nr:hypothetical protein FACS189428_3300 [Clostridia bacterium]